MYRPPNCKEIHEPVGPTIPNGVEAGRYRRRSLACSGNLQRCDLDIHPVRPDSRVREFNTHAVDSGQAHIVLATPVNRYRVLVNHTRLKRVKLCRQLFRRMRPRNGDAQRQRRHGRPGSRANGIPITRTRPPHINEKASAVCPAHRTTPEVINGGRPR